MTDNMTPELTLTPDTDAAAVAVPELTPVSYTHLTLPTNSKV